MTLKDIRERFRDNLAKYTSCLKMDKKEYDKFIQGIKKQLKKAIEENKAKTK